jgi:hypothetical protein
LKQGCRVSITIRLGLHQVNKRLLISLLCAQKRELADVRDLHLFGSEVERNFGGIARRYRCFQGVIILIERVQGVRNIFKRGQHRTAILFGSLNVGSSGGALAGDERPP